MRSDRSELVAPMSCVCVACSPHDPHKSELTRVHVIYRVMLEYRVENSIKKKGITYESLIYNCSLYLVKTTLVGMLN